jgi:hypothetical protein
LPVKNFCLLLCRFRDVSSVGLEHRLDRAGVVGSNPSHPTTENPVREHGIFCFSEKQTCLDFRKNKKDRMSEANTGFSIDAPPNGITESNPHHFITEKQKRPDERSEYRIFY